MEIPEENKVFIAGSTRRGEEEVIIEVFLELIKTYPNILMIIAPRHIERTGEVEKLLQQSNLEFILKTDLDKGIKREHKRVIVVNTIGDLSRVYSVGTIIFCGGSLVPLGGQNILEAAAWGKVVLYGPSMENFADAKELLEGVGAGMEVSGFDDLKATCLELLGHPERLRKLGEAGRDAVMANRGAAERNVLLIEELLEGKIK